MIELQESSLNRVADFIRRYDIACITAYRDKFENATAKTLDDRPEELKERDKAAGITDPSKFTPYKYTTADKKRRNHELRAELLDLKYGVTTMRGNYIENFGTLSAKELGEDSCFVVNLHDDPLFYNRLFALSEYYNQDCFLFKSKDSEEAYNVGTNNGQYPGYAQKDNIGKLHFNIENEFLSRVGNKSFSFAKGGNHRHDNRRNDFETRKKERIGEAKAVFNCEVYEDYQVGAKMTIHSIATGVELGMKKLRETASSKLHQYVESLQRLAEGFGDVDMTGWDCIGEIKNGSPFGAGGDIYLMADPQFEGMKDRNEFKRLHTKFNTKPDGSGMQTDSIPTYTLQRLFIYPDYQDTYFGEVFLGKRKGAEGEEQHKQFMARLNRTGNDKVTLTHNSSEEIRDGVIRYTCKHNNYSNNSDVGCYFWGSAKVGSDPSGNSRFTYYCEVPEERIYDFQTNLERLTLQQAMSQYPYVAQNWNDGQAIVVTSFAVTPIAKIRDNSNGKVYDGPWKELQLHETSRRQKAQAAMMGKRKNSIRTMCVVSPENPMGVKASPEDNAERRKKFCEYMQNGHIPYYQTRGKYKDPENSFILYNISQGDAAAIAAMFEQESFIFVELSPEDNRYRYQYWECVDPKKGYRKTKEEEEYVDATNDQDMYTAISRKFKFRIPFVFECAETLGRIMAEHINETEELERRLSAVVSENRTGYSKYMSRGFLYGKHVNLNEECSLLGGLKNYGILQTGNDTISDLNRLHFNTMVIGENRCVVFNVPVSEMIYQTALVGKDSFDYFEMLGEGIIKTMHYEKSDMSKPSTVDNPFVVKSTVYEAVSSKPDIIRSVDKVIAEWRDHPIRRGSGESYVDLSINGVGEVPFRCRKGIYEHVQRSLHLNT